MKIAVDATGGDYAPCVVVEAVAQALYELPEYEIVLVGPLGKLPFYLEKYGIANHPRLSLEDAKSNVEMREPSAISVRAKKDSSITVCAKLLHEGKVDAIVSAGHTGAAVAATKIIVRTLPGVDRAALGTNMPRRDGRFLLVDAGANPDTNPRNLLQFGIMGSIYAEFLYKVQAPRVALLSVGGEDCKGKELTKEAFDLFEKAGKAGLINFVGNIEANTIFDGSVDVMVSDGFTGNVFLKCCEGFGKMVLYWLKNAITKDPLRLAGAALVKNAFLEVKGKGDSDIIGGAPLLGLNGICIIGHGASSPFAVFNAIKLAGECYSFKLNEKIVSRIKAAEALQEEEK